MKKAQMIALLCALLLLAGCADPTAPTDPPSAPASGTNGNPVPGVSESPTVTLETESPEPRPAAQRVEKLNLEPLPAIAPKDRCLATALGRIAETENGYYVATPFDYLYYADKRDMEQWFLVCNAPDCKHDDILEVCNAKICGAIWEKDGSIYTVNPRHAAHGTPDFILKSKGDGGNWEVAFSDPNCPFVSEGGYMISWQFHNGACMNVSQMGTDGMYDNFLYIVDKTGSYKYTYAEDLPDAAIGYTGNTGNQARGDVTMGLVAESPGVGAPVGTGSVLYRVRPEAVEKLDLPEGCSYYGSYLSGDTMIHYHPDDGFYKLDYDCGTEAKIADAAYEDGFGYCLDGEFLVETTVNWQSTAKECKLRYFDGENWTEVPLPEAFTPETNLRIVALTSDTLFLEEMSTALYMVKLGDNQMVKCMDYSDTNLR